MEKALERARPDGKLNIFVQVHGDGEPTRGWVGQIHEPVPVDQRDVTDGKALASFILWALHDQAKHPSR